MEENKISKGVLISIIISTILVVTVIIITLVTYLGAPMKEIKKKLDGGEIHLTYSDDGNVFALNNLNLITDEAGMALDAANLYYDFTVAVDIDKAEKIDYEIAVQPDKSTTIDTNNIRVYLEKEENKIYTEVFEPTSMKLSINKSKLGTPSKSMVIYKDSVTDNTKDNYRLRIWVPEETKLVLQPTDVIAVKVIVNGKAS